MGITSASLSLQMLCFFSPKLRILLFEKKEKLPLFTVKQVTGRRRGKITSSILVVLKNEGKSKLIIIIKPSSGDAFYSDTSICHACVD